MANGTAALQLVESAPASSGEPIERRVGEAVADAVSAVAKALHEYGWTTAGLTPATKEAGAAQIAKLYKIFQASPNLDLIAARRECLRTIWARYGDDIPEAMINTLITETLEVVDKVTDSMRLTAN